jgi:hypothetical protein
VNGLGKDVVFMPCFGSNLAPNPLMILGNKCSNLVCKLAKPGCKNELLKGGNCVGVVEVAAGAADLALHPLGKQFVGYPCVQVTPTVSMFGNDSVPLPDLKMSAEGKYVAGAWKVCDCKDTFLPVMNLPELPSLELDLPSLPTIDLPSLPTINLPSLPSLPTIEKPKGIDLSSVLGSLAAKTPSITLPDLAKLAEAVGDGSQSKELQLPDLSAIFGGGKTGGSSASSNSAASMPNMADLLNLAMLFNPAGAQP